MTQINPDHTIVTIEGEEVKVTEQVYQELLNDFNQGVIDVVIRIEGDDHTITLAENFPVEIGLSKVFANVLKKWLTPEEMTEVNRLNATPEYTDACASHNYCDSNEAMIEAFQNVMGKDIVFDDNEEDTVLMDAAWTIASKNLFYINDK